MIIAVIAAIIGGANGGMMIPKPFTGLLRIKAAVDVMTVARTTLVKGTRCKR